MSTSVDERVVSMKFDNKQFESGTATSLSTLDRLKKGLNMESASKSLDGLSESAKNVSFNGLANGIETVKVQFGALQVVAMTALANITNSALDAGKNLISSLTIDPITDGFKEYETQMGAIQTVLANTSSKGTTLDQVNKALAELNTYSDKTIYNFTEMTKNIGTFTAAGVDLNTSVSAIKGIANLAAVSGSNSEQASTAMYQLSQAMAAGAVKLQDWNSVVNAGMGGEVFQKSLEETARVHGINIDAMIKREGSFRETLKDGWLSTSILTETLSKYTGDLSAEQLKALGYSTQQTTEIIKMGQVANDAATKVKTFTQLLDTLKEAVGSGWAQTWQTVFGNFDEAKVMFTDVSNALGGIIGESSQARNSVLSGWKDLGGRTVLIDAIRIAFENVMNVVKAVTSAFREVFPPTTSTQLYNMTVALKTFVSGLTMSKTSLENLHKTFAGLFAVLDIAVQVISFVAKAIGLVVSAIFPVTGGFLAATGSIGGFLVMIDNAIKNSGIFTTALKYIAGAMSIVRIGVVAAVTEMGKIFGTAGILIKPLIDDLIHFVKTSTLMEDIVDKITEVFTKYINKLNEVIKTSTDFKTSSSGITGVFEKIWAVLEKVGGAIKTVFGPSIDFLVEKLKGVNLSNIGAILAGGGILMIAKSFKSAIGSIKDVTGGFSEVIEGITGSLEAFQTKLKAEALLKIAIAIGILAVSVVALSMIKTDALVRALGALTILFTELAIGITILQKATTSAPGLSVQLIALGVAVSLIASAVKKLSDINSQQLAVGVQGLTSILTVLAIFIKVTSGAQVQMGMSGLVGIAAAILILCTAVEKFGTMDTNVMTKGIQGIVSALVVLGLFIKGIGSPENMIGIGIGLTAMAGALVIFAGAIFLFGNMSLMTLAIGIGAMAAALLVIAISAKAMTGTLAGSAALVIMVGAISLLVPAIVILGNLPINVIKTALLALAGIFLTLGASALILAPLTPVILALAIAMGIIGVSVYALGGGLVLFAAGLAALAAGGAVFIAAFTSAVTIILNQMPTIAKKLGEIMIAFADAIKGALPSIVSMVKSLATELIKAFNELIMPVVNAAVKFLVAFLTTVGQYVQPLVDVGLKLIISFTKAIITNLPQLVDSAVKLMLAFLDAIQSKIPAIISSGIDVMLQFLYGIASKLGDIIDSAFKIVITFINGLADAVTNNHQAIIDATGRLINAVVDALMDMVPMLFDVGVNIVKGIIKGVESMGNALKDGFNGLVTSGVDSVKKLLGIHSPSTVFKEEVGAMIGAGMAEGITESTPEAVSAADKMAQSVVDAAKKWIDERKYYNQISLEEELYVWETIQAKYEEGDSARKEADKEVYRLKKEIIDKEAADTKAAFDKSVEEIDDRKYYNQMSLKEEYAAWSEIQQKYIEGSEERKKADKEVYRVKQELMDKEKASLTEIDDLNTSYNQKIVDLNTQTNTDRETLMKDYNQSILDAQTDVNDKKKTLETDYNQNVLDVQTAANTKRTSLEDTYAKDVLAVNTSKTEKLKTLEDDYYAKTTEVNAKLVSDIQTLNDAYAKAVDTRTSSLYSVYGLFDAVSSKEVVTGASLTKNLKDQISEFDSWATNLKELSKKGIDEGLISELTAMGPKAVEQIKALNGLSTPELEEYVKLWQTKNSDAKDEATTELESLKTETAAKIATLNSDTATSLETYKTTWQTNMKAVTDDADAQLTTLETNYNTSLATLNSDTTTQLNTLNTNFVTQLATLNSNFDSQLVNLNSNLANKLNTLNTTSATQLETLKQEWSTKVDALRQSTETEFSTLETNIGTSTETMRTNTEETVNTMSENVGTTVETMRTNTEGSFDTMSENVGYKMTGLKDNTEGTFTDLGEDIPKIMAKPDWDGVGGNIVAGIKKGVTSKSVDLANECARVALMALNAAKAALGIASPSKEFTKVGEFAGQGLVNGIVGYGQKVASSASDLANSALDSLSNAISGISEIVTTSIDSEPVIRPVLDLTAVVAGASTLNSMLDKTQSISAISNSLQAKSGIQNDIKSGTTSTNPVDTGTHITQNVEIYSPTALSPVETARQNMRLLQELGLQY